MTSFDMDSDVAAFVSHIGDVQFIDYEYSGYNYLAYDIGNHFNEFAGKKWISEVKVDWFHKKKKNNPKPNEKSQSNNEQ